MELHIYLKGKKEPEIYNGDRIDVLNFAMSGTNYKQVRYFRNGISKSHLIEAALIQRIVEI